MRHTYIQSLCHHALVAITTLLVTLSASSTLAGEYAALDGVSGIDAVFDISLGSPQAATVVFPAIRGAYQDSNVTALHATPRVVLVFHGGATKLISTDRSDFDEKDHAALDKVADMIRQFKKDGVRMEVCMYAVNALGIDPNTLLPEIDRVGNGFISVLGYQARGYSLVTIP